MTDELTLRLFKEKMKVRPSVLKPECVYALMIKLELQELGMSEQDIIDYLALTNIVHKELGLSELLHWGG